MPRFEILHDLVKLTADFLVAQGQYLVDQPARAARVGAISLPSEMEGANHDSCGVRLEP